MKPLVVIGDSILDMDIDGTAERLCPEGPAPVVDVEAQWHRPGGAGLAALLAARGASDVVLVTALGDDTSGRCLRNLLSNEVELVPLAMLGETVSKTRIRAAGVTLVRLDTGDGRADESATTPDLSAVVREAGAVLVSDYGRGVTALPEVRAALTDAAVRIPVVWDPHPRGTEPVIGATLVTPNRAESVRFLGNEIPEARAAALLADRWQARSVAITVGAEGAVIGDATGTSEIVAVPPSARVPSSLRPDTCGAGDRFAGAAAAALLAGSTTAAAVHDAVESAARFVGAGGAAAVSTGVETPHHAGPARPSSMPDALDVAEQVRRSGGRVVATGGCFDLLHCGHLSLLRQARAQGDALVVCLNSDDSVRRAKGPGRPVVRVRDRARVLLELRCVDAVAVFDEDTPVRVLERLRPHVWVKGSDYADQELPEAAVLAAHGGQIVFVPVVPGYSTTRMVRAAAGA